MQNLHTPPLKKHWTVISPDPTFALDPCYRHSPENAKEEEPMKITLPIQPSGLRRWRKYARRLAVPSLMLLAAAPVYAQAANDPWDNAVNVLRTAFTGPIATGLSLVAIVVGGLMFAYGEGQSKRMLAGIIFGIGMAVGAVNFMSWLFPG